MGIWLDQARMTNREDLGTYMQDLFGVPAEEAENLDRLADSLSEARRDVSIRISRSCLQAICRNDFSYGALCVLAGAASQNPHITIRLGR